MRALDSRRPTQGSCCPRRLTRSCLLVLLVVHAFGDARARNVPFHDGSEPRQDVPGPLTDEVRVAEVREDPRVPEDGNPLVDVARAETNVGRTDVLGGEEDETFSVPKKRRRNDVLTPFVKPDDPGAEKDHQQVADEGIRRFDAQVDTDEEVALSSREKDDAKDSLASQSGVKNVGMNAEDAEIHQRRLVDVVKPTFQDTPEINIDQRASFKQKKNIQGDKNSEEIPVYQEDVEIPLDDPGRIIQEIIGNVDAASINTDIRNDLRSLEPNEKPDAPEDTKDVNENGRTNTESIVQKSITFREDRQLQRNQGKPKYRTSTIYLNAEEENTPTRDQEAIVDDQIKKLISIRDDALDSITAKASEISSSEEITQIGDNISDGLVHVKTLQIDQSPHVIRSEVRQNSPPARLKKWKEEAFRLQEQIKDRAILQKLKEQANEILPDAPKFDEHQLLNALKAILSTKDTTTSESYASNLNATLLTNDQLEIIKCTEQLVDVKQRQSFIQNMADCIRGWDVLNCIRIFVWPILAENMPDSLAQNIPALPIEVNLMDLFQGNRDKSGRSTDSGGHRQPVLTPYTMVIDILSDAVKNLPQAEATHTFFDVRNETIKKLLSANQVEILQMAEKVLPTEVRREYADRMISCVRRFEYFSCVKYFTWPLVKQYYPNLPLFPLPDYDPLYTQIPVISGYPQYPLYPIPPFPGFSEGTGELPEVVDVDGTRMKIDRRPEAMIVHILRDTLKEHSKLPESPTALDPKDTFVAVIPQEQLMAVYMAEQLLPAPYRPEFVQKTVRCIHEYNYLSCIKYSTWPTIRQFVPALPQFPDISGWFTDFQLPEIPDFFGFIPALPSFPDVSGLFSGPTPQTTQRPLQVTESEPVAVLLRDNNKSPENANCTEAKIMEILLKVRDSLKKAPDAPSLIMGGNVVILTTITEDQINILKLAESILPPQARAPLLSQILACLEEKNDFVNCTRCIVWPTINIYAPNLPEFPGLLANENSARSSNAQDCLRNSKSQLTPDKLTQEQIITQILKDPNVQITSRNPMQRDPTSRNHYQGSIPVISVTGTHFVPILSEHPETVLLSILRTVQLSVPNASNRQNVPNYSQILNDVQKEIVRIVDNLLPESIRGEIVTRTIDCMRENNFLVCTRDIIWPAMLQYFPSLPTFPNFGPSSSDKNITSTSSAQNLTESGSNTDTMTLSETNVKTGQQGDAMVTIMDTRFVPIFSEHPEGVIMNILRAVQLSTPNLSAGTTFVKSNELSNLLTEQQINILQLGESLLPEAVRSTFANKMTSCTQETAFLDCMRDIAWPIITQYFPRLPNFPNFGSLQNLPRSKLPQSPLNVSSASNTRNKSVLLAIERAEGTIELILQESLLKDSRIHLEHSYLNTEDPAVGILLTDKQASIIRLIESGIPESERPSYIQAVVKCVGSHTFISCTRNVSWPILKKFLPGLADFSSLNLPELPDLGQLPLPVLPQLPGTFAELPSLPQLAGLPQVPEISQLQGISQLPGFSPAGQNTATQTNETSKQTTKLLAATETSHEQRIDDKETKSIITPSVADQTVVLGNAGQQSEILTDLSNEKVMSHEKKQTQFTPERTTPEIKSRKRRDIMDLLNPSSSTQEDLRSTKQTFPDVTESEFLRLLANISRSRNLSLDVTSNFTKKEYFVDTLNSTTKDSLTADQYEILKMAEDLTPDQSGRGLLQQTIQCIRSLSFIRCVGIFVWPVISSNLPSFPGAGLFGRSAELNVNDLFGMSAAEFEAEFLARKVSIEKVLINWYNALASTEFQKDIGFVRIRGYGNGELGIGFTNSREGRAKIKDNKNLPSILTIISDIMEEVLDQRPDPEKSKRDRDKKERSLRDFQATGYQILNSDVDENASERSINDDKIITMFLEKIRSNSSGYNDGEAKQNLNLDDAYNAFEDLFGTRLNGKFAERLRTFSESHRKASKDTPENNVVHEISIVPLNVQTNDAEKVKVIPLDSRLSYDLEKETSNEQKERNRHRTKNTIVKLMDEYSDRYLQDTRVEEADGERHQFDPKRHQKKSEKKGTELTLQLPRLDDEILPRKTTDSLIDIGKSVKDKMGQMMPGIGLAISFLLQVALAHARAAASVAGILSNMAMGSAMFSMIRDMMFGSNDRPKIKYVYDNDSTKPGVSWPQGPYDSYNQK